MTVARPRWLRLVALLLPLLALSAVWVLGPRWIAPVEDFPQGPGGAVAYISLFNQLQQEAPQFWGGKDTRLELSEPEFSALLSSALLSGRRDQDPVRKVRARLGDNEIQVDAVLALHHPRVPARFQGPVGLRLWLRPVRGNAGAVQFQVAGAAIGRLLLPHFTIQWVSGYLPAGMGGARVKPGTDTIALPLSGLIPDPFGRRVTVRSVSAEPNRFSFTLAMQALSPPAR